MNISRQKKFVKEMTIRFARSFLVLVCWLNIAPVPLSAQAKRDNTISVSGLNFTEVKKALADNDFFIASTDEENKTCFTAPRAMPDFTGWPTANVEFFVHVKNGIALLSAKVDLAGSGTNVGVEFRGLKKGLNMQAFYTWILSPNHSEGR